MTTYLLIRHGAHDLLGKVLCGRMPGVHLNAQGVRQSEWLASRVADFPVDALWSSPLERTMETASVIARRIKKEPMRADAFHEIDVGAWTNRSFAHLENDPAWKRFNQLRSVAYPPGGEGMLAAQCRALAKMEALRQQMPGGCVAIVSHADILKGILAHLLGIPLDLFHRIEISPGSLSIAAVGEDALRVSLLNETAPAEAGSHERMPGRYHS